MFVAFNSVQSQGNAPVQGLPTNYLNNLGKTVGNVDSPTNIADTWKQFGEQTAQTWTNFGANQAKQWSQVGQNQAKTWTGVGQKTAQESQKASNTVFKDSPDFY